MTVTEQIVARAQEIKFVWTMVYEGISTIVESENEIEEKLLHREKVDKKAQFASRSFFDDGGRFRNYGEVTVELAFHWWKETKDEGLKRLLLYECRSQDPAWGMERLEGKLANYGDNWQAAGQAFELALLKAADGFRVNFAAITGRAVDYGPQLQNRIAIALEKAHFIAVLEEVEKNREEMRLKIEELEKRNNILEDTNKELESRLNDLFDQLTAVRQAEKAMQDAAAERARSITSETELELVGLKLVVQKAIADLAATKAFSKSRRFAQIRENLEAALYGADVQIQEGEDH